MADFIPAQDPQALIWMQAFSSGFSANPALYMLTSADAAAIASAVDAFDGAVERRCQPATKTARDRGTER